ncbi:MAG: hypothetical protein AABW99_01725, partial [archaeon]
KGANIYICKDGNSSSCTTWCTDSNTTTTALGCTYTTTVLDVGTKDYNALICDTNSECSSVIAQTFTVDSTPPSTSVKDVNGDTTAPYWATTSSAVKLVINAGEAGAECKWNDTNSASYASFGTLCTTSGNNATCDLGTRGQTTGTTITTYYNCKDSIGNATGGKDVNFGVDSTKPTASINGTVSENGATVIYSGADAHSGLLKYEVRVDSGSYIDKGTSASHAFNDLANGDHTFEVRVTDNAGNTDTNSVVKNVNFTSTSIPSKPAIRSDTHEEDGWTGSNNPEFKWDSDSNATSYRYALNTTSDFAINSGNGESTSGTSKSHSGISEGGKWFHLASCNANGCSSTDHYGIKIDESGPQAITNISGMGQSDGSIYISWVAPEDNPGSDNSGIKEYVVYRNLRQLVGNRDFRPSDSGVKEFGNITRTNFTDDNGLTTGISYYYMVQAIDNAGNEGSLSSIKRFVAGGEPNPQSGSCAIQITISVPENAKGGSTGIKVTATGGKIVNAGLKVKMPGKSFETVLIGQAGTSFGYDYLIPENLSGSATVSVDGEDESGNSCQKNEEFTVDSEKPEISSESLQDGSIASGIVQIKIGASDNGTGIQSAEAFVDGKSIGQLRQSGGLYVLDWNSAGTPNGTHSVEISVQDKAGNKSVSNATITVSNEAVQEEPGGKENGKGPLDSLGQKDMLLIILGVIILIILILGFLVLIGGGAFLLHRHRKKGGGFGGSGSFGGPLKGYENYDKPGRFGYKGK